MHYESDPIQRFAIPSLGKGGGPVALYHQASLAASVIWSSVRS